MPQNKKINLFIVILSVIRHRWLIFFRPIYSISSLLKRKGECKSCGTCCSLNIDWCRHFNNGKCKIYDQQPFFCKIFPIDEKDKDMSGVTKECGYHWGSNE